MAELRQLIWDHNRGSVLDVLGEAFPGECSVPECDGMEFFFGEKHTCNNQGIVNDKGQREWVRGDVSEKKYFDVEWFVWVHQQWDVNTCIEELCSRVADLYGLREQIRSFIVVTVGGREGYRDFPGAVVVPQQNLWVPVLSCATPLPNMDVKLLQAAVCTLHNIIEETLNSSKKLGNLLDEFIQHRNWTDTDSGRAAARLFNINPDDPVKLFLLWALLKQECYDEAKDLLAGDGLCEAARAAGEPPAWQRLQTYLESMKAGPVPRDLRVGWAQAEHGKKQTEQGENTCPDSEKKGEQLQAWFCDHWPKAEAVGISHERWNRFCAEARVRITWSLRSLDPRPPDGSAG